MRRGRVARLHRQMTGGYKFHPVCLAHRPLEPTSYLVPLWEKSCLEPRAQLLKEQSRRVSQMAQIFWLCVHISVLFSYLRPDSSRSYICIPSVRPFWHFALTAFVAEVAMTRVASGCHGGLDSLPVGMILTPVVLCGDAYLLPNNTSRGWLLSIKLHSLKIW